MPFRSKRQQRFMYANKPKGVDLKEWAEKTDFEKIPERARKKRTKKDKNNLMEGDIDLNSQPDDPVKKALAYATEYHRQVKLAFSGRDIAHLALDLAGFIPVMGEAADFANAAMYVEEGNYFFAALSLISMVPEIGDAIGKGTKALAYIAKVAPDAAELIAKHGPKIAEIIRTMRTVIKANRHLIKPIMDKVAENEKLKDHVDQIEGALDAFTENDIS